MFANGETFKIFLRRKIYNCFKGNTVETKAHKTEQVGSVETLRGTRKFLK